MENKFSNELNRQTSQQQMLQLKKKIEVKECLENEMKKLFK